MHGAPPRTRVPMCELLRPCILGKELHFGEIIRPLIQNSWSNCCSSWLLPARESQPNCFESLDRVTERCAAEWDALYRKGSSNVGNSRARKSSRLPYQYCARPKAHEVA